MRRHPRPANQGAAPGTGVRLPGEEGVLLTPVDPYPDEPTEPAEPTVSGAPVRAPLAAPAPSPGRAGRNLPAAIAVGVILGTLVISTLFTVRWLFIALAAVAVVVATSELLSALAAGGYRPPRWPLLAGAAGMVLAAYGDGPEGLLLALMATVLVTQGWAWAASAVGAAVSADGPAGQKGTLVSAGALAAVYVGFLAGYAALLARPANGPRLVLIFIAAGVASDIGGYTAGVLAGKHPMAPTVSPKKSWEGFAGSAAACIAWGAITIPLLLDGSVWLGFGFGAAVVLAATLGDLGESMIKRDLGIKDMGTLLPGHGGLMDRLDSLLVVAPVAWLILSHV
jgi:phosphatidate cytidylyltransferase